MPFARSVNRDVSGPSEVGMTESYEIRLSFFDGDSETVCVTRLAADCYRLDETPIFNEEEPVYFGDVLELEPQADGTHRFKRVVEHAPLHHYNWMVPEFFVESPQYGEFCNAVRKAGGAWERVMGGLLLVHVPLNSGFDTEQELDRCIAAAQGVMQKRY